MTGLFRAGGRAAAFLLLAALVVTPSAARATGNSVPAVAPASLQPAGASDPGAGAVGATPMQQPLTVDQMVGAFVDFGNQDAEQLCLAKAVYFEARGETLEGQLAVAEVILNRAASGLYPSTICGVVTQKAQFSFIRRGKFPNVKLDDGCWHKALAIADIARSNRADRIAANVLWYHARYVRPAWGRRLTKVATIGTHIFYS